MKRYLSLLVASMLCVCCLALAACGSSTSSSAASSGDASSSAGSSSAAADPADAFVGTWKLAALETEGITIAGDFSQMLDTEEGSTLTIDADGTGSMTFGDDAADITWTAGDDGSFTIAPTNESGGGDIPDTLAATLDDGVVSIVMSDDEFEGTLIYTETGTVAGAEAISAEGATAITSESDLLGTWNLTGINMEGITMYGSAADLAAIMGDETTTAVEFAAGGTATLMGEEIPYTVNADGAYLGVDDYQIPVKASGDDIVIDVTEMLGGAIELTMVFSR